MNFRASCTGHYFCISSPAQKRIYISALLLFDWKKLTLNFSHVIFNPLCLWIVTILLGENKSKMSCVCSWALHLSLEAGGACSRDGDPGKVKDECCNTSLLFSSEGATHSPTTKLWYLSEPDALILVEQYKHRKKSNPATAGKNKQMQKQRTDQDESRLVKETTTSELLQFSHYLHKADSMTRDLKEQANSLSPGWALQGGLWLINSNWKYSSHPAALLHSFPCPQLSWLYLN